MKVSKTEIRFKTGFKQPKTGLQKKNGIDIPTQQVHLQTVCKCILAQTQRQQYVWLYGLIRPIIRKISIGRNNGADVRKFLLLEACHSPDELTMPGTGTIFLPW